LLLITRDFSFEQFKEGVLGLIPNTHVKKQHLRCEVYHFGAENRLLCSQSDLPKLAVNF
jgi:hypothetical protein